MTEDPPSTEGIDPPTYDAAAVGAVAKRVEISNVELVHAHFERDDDGVLPPDDELSASLEPEILLDVEGERDSGGSTLAYLVRFGAESEPAGFRVYAFFRLTYSLTDDKGLTEADFEQFGHWNAVFNAWPYFREYVSSTANRAGLPRLTLPVMRVPRAD